MSLESRVLPTDLKRVWPPHHGGGDSPSRWTWLRWKQIFPQKGGRYTSQAAIDFSKGHHFPLSDSFALQITSLNLRGWQLSPRLESLAHCCYFLGK